MADNRIDQLILDKLDKVSEECSDIKDKLVELREDFIEHQSTSKVYMEIDSEKSRSAEEYLKKLDGRLQTLEDERSEQMTIKSYKVMLIKRGIVLIGLLGTIATILYRFHII